LLRGDGASGIERAMLKYALFALTAIVAGFGIWFWRLPGPHQLNLADRWWLGPAEHDAPPQVGLSYGEHARQRLDIYKPAGDGTKPVLLFFHGGSWRDGDRAGYGFVGRAFAARGFVTVIADYRKYPEVKFPDFVKDAAAATQWVHGNIARHGGDPDRVFLMGHSAGAHLVSLVANDPQWLSLFGADDTIIKGTIALAGPHDFYPFTNEAAQAALGDWPDPEATQPISYVRADAPPMLLLHGEQDKTVKVRNSRMMAKAIEGKGGIVELKTYADIDHADIIMAVARPFRSKATIVEDVLSFAAKFAP
jgi:acetyl esterase/lipase